MPATDSLLALDVGERRIGLALASVEARLAHPYGVIDRSVTNLWLELERVVTEERVKEVVIGLPRGLEGQETAQTGVVRTFADDFKQRFALPVSFQDEALSSKRAEAELDKRGVRYTKGDVDALAATYILEDFLKEN